MLSEMVKLSLEGDKNDLEVGCHAGRIRGVCLFGIHERGHRSTCGLGFGNCPCGGRDLCGGDPSRRIRGWRVMVKAERRCPKIETENHRKAHRSKKAYPPHWCVRVMSSSGGGALYRIDPHRQRDCRGFSPYSFLDAKQGGGAAGLRELLDYMADLHPHTSAWPVRFLNCREEACGRPVLVV